MSLERIDCEKNTTLFIDIANKNNFIELYKRHEQEISVKIGASRLEEIINIFIQSNSIRTSSIMQEMDHVISLEQDFITIDNLFNQLNEHVRRFNRGDFRHCENHPQRLHNKSPLIGGVNGFDNAESLLASSIGDIRSKHKYLLNIDHKNKNFIIRYEDENFNNQYHAFHIVKKDNYNQYIVDNDNVKFLTTKKGLPRALRLINFRKELSIL